MTMGDLELQVRDSGMDKLLVGIETVEQHAARLGKTPITIRFETGGVEAATKSVANSIATIGVAGTQSGAAVAAGMAQATAALGTEAVDRLVLRFTTLEEHAKTLQAPITIKLNGDQAEAETQSLASGFATIGTTAHATGEQIARGMERATSATAQLTRTLEEQQRAWVKEGQAPNRDARFLGPATPGMSTQQAAQLSREAAEAQARLTAQTMRYTQQIDRVIANLVQMGRTLDVTNAKGVATFKGSAEATTAYAVRLGATETQLNRIGAAIDQVDRRQGALATSTQRVGQAATTSAGGFTIFGRNVTDSSGKLSAFSRSGIGSLNAVAFGLTSLLASGNMSFRGLASAAAGFLAFFGPQGAIASLILSTGLAITDFFNRTRREIEETKKKAQAELASLKESIETQRITGDQEGLIERFRIATIRLGEAETERAELIATLTPKEKELEELRKRAPITAGSIVSAWKAENKELIDRRDALNTLIPQLQEEARLAKAAVPNIIERPQPRTLPVKVNVKETRDAAEIEKERQQNISRTVDALTRLSQLHALTGADLQEITRLEKVLNDELNRGNLARTRRATIVEELGRLKEAGTLSTGNLTVDIPIAPRIDAKKFNEQLKRLAAADALKPDAAALAAIEEQMNFEDSIANGIASSLINGITRGFAEGFARGGLKEGVRALLSDVLSGMGTIFMQIGQRAIVGMAFIQKIVSAITSWSPWVGIPAAIALMAFGAALGGKGGGGGGGGGAAGFATPERDTVQHIWLDPDRRLTPVPGPRSNVAPEPRSMLPANPVPSKPIMVTVNQTIIGPNDPKAQREIAQLVVNAGRAGYPTS